MMLGMATAALSAPFLRSVKSWAAGPVPIGVITTLSGPAGYLGQDIRDGLQLAVDLGGGALGGIPVSLKIEDDALKPGNGKQIASRLLKSEDVRLFTGIVFSNVVLATVPDIVDAGAIYISPNAGPSTFAGKDCNENYFVTSWQNDTQHEAAGELANKAGQMTAFVIAPNYQAGKDAINGFKRTYKGRIVGEIYTQLDQLDFAGEMAQIRAASPAVVYESHPGASGIAFIRHYSQAGLSGSIPLIVTEGAFDAVTLKVVGDLAKDIRVVATWNEDFDNPANRLFVSEWNKKYDRPATHYASRGYDTGLLIGAALKALGGDVSKVAELRNALRKAEFDSVRGKFAFGRNQHPVQDFWLLRIEKTGDGRLALQKVDRIYEAKADFYALNCKM